MAALTRVSDPTPSWVRPFLGYEPFSDGSPPLLGSNSRDLLIQTSHRVCITQSPFFHPFLTPFFDPLHHRIDNSPRDLYNSGLWFLNLNTGWPSLHRAGLNSCVKAFLWFWLSRIFRPSAFMLCLLVLLVIVYKERHAEGLFVDRFKLIFIAIFCLASCKVYLRKTAFLPKKWKKWHRADCTT